MSAFAVAPPLGLADGLGPSRLALVADAVALTCPSSSKVRKILSPTTIGVEEPAAGNSTFQTRFSDSPQVSGSLVDSLSPSFPGPRPSPPLRREKAATDQQQGKASKGRSSHEKVIRRGCP